MSCYINHANLSGRYFCCASQQSSSTTSALPLLIAMSLALLPGIPPHCDGSEWPSGAYLRRNHLGGGGRGDTDGQQDRQNERRRLRKRWVKHWHGATFPPHRIWTKSSPPKPLTPERAGQPRKQVRPANHPHVAPLCMRARARVDARLIGGRFE